MKKLLIGITCLLTANLSFATVTPTQQEYDSFYQALQSDMPFTLHQLSFMVAFVQMSAESVGKSDPKNRFDPTDPKFAQCMQTAIDQPFYEPTLKQNFDSYLQQATPTDFQHDLKVYSQHNFQSNSKLYRDIFAIYAKGKSSQGNIAISQQKLKQRKPIDNFSPFLGKEYDGLLSESYYDFFSEKSSLGEVIGKQLQACQIIQNAVK